MAQSEPERVLELVRRYGWNATSFQVLEPGYRYFFVEPDACVAFVDTGGAWVAAGAPLAREDRLADVTAAFLAAARATGRRACLFATESRFASRVPLRALLVGEQPVWDPAAWEAATRASPSLREQVRRARAKGVRVRAVDAHDATTADAPNRAAVLALHDRWLGTRELAPMGFLARVEPEPFLPGQRLFLAERGSELVAMLFVAPVWGRDGWLLQNLIRSPEAPNGSSELLVDHAMRAARHAGHRFVTLGLAPLAGDVRPPLRLARAAGRALYDFRGLRAFKSKLKPDRWDPVYLSYPPETSAPRAVVDVLTAFAHGGLLRFGLRTLARGPAIVVTLLAWLLLPWIALLASADAGRWFPHPGVKWAWVGFDAVVAAGLFALESRWRAGLARGLTAAIGADAILTAIEAAWWNLPREPGFAPRVVIAAAVLAPAVAFVMLRRATARRQA